MTQAGLYLALVVVGFYELLDGFAHLFLIHPSSFSSSEHPTLPRPGLYALLSLSCSGVGLSFLGCSILDGGYTSVSESIQPVRGKARAGVGSDVSGLQQFID